MLSFFKFFVFSTFLLSIPTMVSSQQTVQNEFGFIVPAELTKVRHNPQYDEIIKYSYHNELFISVQDFLNRSPNKGKGDPIISLQLGVNVKSARLKSLYQGYDLQELEKQKINGNPYMWKRFDSKQPGFPVHFEFGAMYVVKSDKIYEFLITGKQENIEKHREIVRRFLEGIR